MTDSDNTHDPRVEQQAQIEEFRERRLNWWLPLLAIALAAYLGAQSWFKRGPRLTIHAAQGYGLGVGDPLKYRGVVLGEVEAIELAPRLDSVALRIRLEPEAESLCRVGSRFWIVHPEVGLDRLQGLETIVGARYIRVDPGQRDTAARYEFDALPEPPAQEQLAPGGLVIRLLALRRGGLARGAQLTYRGVQVGTVLATRLTSDATGVEIEAYVRPPYVELVRDNSQFWRTGGFEVNLALLRGLSVELDSLRGLMVGGIAFATPDQAGLLFSGPTPFELHDEAMHEWERWRPSLTLGVQGEASLQSDSVVLRASLCFEQDGWFGRDKRIEGWVVALPGAILGPRELLETPSDAEAGSAELDVNGQQVSLESEPVWEGLGLIKRRVDGAQAEVLQPLCVAFAPELQDCQIGGLPLGQTLAVSRSRLQADELGWRLDADIDLDDILSGALVFGLADGRNVGILLKGEDAAHVVPFLAEQW